MAAPVLDTWAPKESNSLSKAASTSTSSSTSLQYGGSKSTGFVSANDDGRRRQKRSVFHLFNMMTCATDCNPLDYKGYGCYCGFLGSGVVVDGIDKCCKAHDWCYEAAQCDGLKTYFAPYRWRCNGGKPYCVPMRGPFGGPGSCGHQLCECDRLFAECLKQQPCPKTKAMCMTSPLRYWQNLFMGMSTGVGMHDHQDHYANDAL
ncbi:basic phospholipase A2 PA-12C [Oratosquilla oratoria]|uniref:basic phospholipase A2 PA-12C n=1 Tax=Oratosquilla oratoria TaxID=337810 RepID=UPI003F761E49